MFYYTNEDFFLFYMTVQKSKYRKIFYRYNSYVHGHGHDFKNFFNISNNKQKRVQISILTVFPSRLCNSSIFAKSNDA